MLTVDPGRLGLFAEAIGEQNEIYVDESAAKVNGYAALPVPPTFLFAAELDSGVMFGVLDQLGMPREKALHAEQSFEYLAPVIAGDVVTVSSRITNVYDRKGGTLEFIERLSEATNQYGTTVVRLRSLLVVKG